MRNDNRGTRRELNRICLHAAARSTKERLPDRRVFIKVDLPQMTGPCRKLPDKPSSYRVSHQIASTGKVKIRRPAEPFAYERSRFMPMQAPNR
jgi:hypothetical protein